MALLLVHDPLTLFLLFFNDLLLGTFIDWLDPVHVRNSILQLWVPLKFFFSHAEELSNVNLFGSVSIYDLKEALSRDSIVLRRVVLLAFVSLHLRLHLFQLRETST